MFESQIGIPCGPNSELFVNFLLSTINKTIHNKKTTEIILGINKPGIKLDLITQGIKELNLRVVERHSNHQSSFGHADCLNLIFENMNAQWGFFLDADTAVLKKEWDLDLIGELTENTVMIGSEYYKNDGKMVKRPNVITCAFDIKTFKKLKIDFMPSMKTIVIDEKNKNIFGSPIGSKIFLDTGCDMIENLISSGYETKVLNIVSPRYPETNQNLKVLDLNQRGEEYHLSQKAISTHIGRSLSRDFNSDPIILNWKQKIIEWFDGQI